MRKNAISRKCGWDHAAEQYLQTYQWALNSPDVQIIKNGLIQSNPHSIYECA